MAGLALAGGAIPTPAIADADPTPASTSAAAGPAEPAPPATAPTIVLEHPAREGLLVRPGDLVVSGYLRGGTGPVRVLVETSRNKMLAVETVEPVTVGAAGRDPDPPFSVTLPIADPRQGERLIIHVVAYDGDGIPVEVLRRRVVVGSQEPGVPDEAAGSPPAAAP